MLRAILDKFDQVEELAVVDLTPKVKDISEPVFSIAKIITEDFPRFLRIDGDLPRENERNKVSLITLTDTELKFSLSWKIVECHYTAISIHGTKAERINRYAVIEENGASPWLTLDEVEFLEETHRAAKKLHLATKNIRLREKATKLYKNTKIWEF
jgi:hypothetical protein